MDKPGLYLNGEYLGRTKHIPEILPTGDEWGICGRVIKGPRWYRPWSVRRWMTDKEFEAFRKYMAEPVDTPMRRDLRRIFGG